MIFQEFLQSRKNGQKSLAVLIDPDKGNETALQHLVVEAATAGVHYFFLGGSLLESNRISQWIQRIRELCTIPVILFPGNTYQIAKEADAILFLSLVSGRNADLLIGRQVEAAPLVREAGLEVISTAYLLIDGGKPTTVSYISGTFPIPADKPQIAAATALASEMLGFKMLYLDAGSGADNPVSPEIISAVAANTQMPIIAGGGINSVSRITAALNAGADILVIGNILEKEPNLIFRMAEVFHEYNKKKYNKKVL